MNTSTCELAMAFKAPKEATRKTYSFEQVQLILYNYSQSTACDIWLQIKSDQNEH